MQTPLSAGVIEAKPLCICKYHYEFMCVIITFQRYSVEKYMLIVFVYLLLTK